MLNGDPTGPHCSHRLFEWAMATAMLLFGLHVMMTPDTFANSRYSAVLLILPTTYFAAACILIGGGRVVALTKNGQWPVWGPRLRAALALAAAAIWAQLAVALSQPPTGRPSPGMWIYLVLMGAELRSVWRARRDGNG